MTRPADLRVSMDFNDYMQFRSGIVTWRNLGIWALQWRKFRKAVLAAQR
jgi:hypothetical protein